MQFNWSLRPTIVVVCLLAGCGGKPTATSGQLVANPRTDAAAATVASAAVAAEVAAPSTHSEIAIVTKPAIQDAESVVPAPAIDDEIRQPATVAEAAKAIDLSTFPLMPGAKEAGTRVVASLRYEVAGELKAIFEFQRSNLLDRNWKQLSEPQIYDSSASGQFGKD